jgi:hypothetical protein
MAICARRAQTMKGGSRRLRRAALRALALAGVVGLSLLASACGDSSDAKVAQVDTNNNAKGSQSSSASGNLFSACMRRHGVPNFPDPGADGRIRIGPEIDDRSPTVRAAYRACRNLAPSEDSLTGQGDVMQQDQLLAFAKCMRSHGVPAFPDPQVVNDHIRLRVTAGQIDPNSPVVTAAMAACRSTLGANSARGAEKLVQGAAGSATGGPARGKGK